MFYVIIFFKSNIHVPRRWTIHIQNLFDWHMITYYK